MIQRSLNQKYRAAALVGAAVVFATMTAGRAQGQALTNLFGGTASNAAATVSGSSLASQTSGMVGLGSGYTGTVTTPIAVLGSVSETVNAVATPSEFVLTTSGVTAGATFNANANFATAGLQPNATYALSFTSVNNSSVTLLSNAGFVLSLGGTAFANTSTGLGILGVANVLGVLNSGGVTTVDFTTPANITPTSTVNIAIQGTLGAAVGTGSPVLIVSGASISQVPEPGTLASAGAGLAGLLLWQARRRSYLG